MAKDSQPLTTQALESLLTPKNADPLLKLRDRNPPGITGDEAARARVAEKSQELEAARVANEPRQLRKRKTLELGSGNQRITQPQPKRVELGSKNSEPAIITIATVVAPVSPTNVTQLANRSETRSLFPGQILEEAARAERAVRLWGFMPKEYEANKAKAAGEEESRSGGKAKEAREPRDDGGRQALERALVVYQSGQHQDKRTTDSNAEVDLAVITRATSPLKTPPATKKGPTIRLKGLPPPTTQKGPTTILKRAAPPASKKLPKLKLKLSVKEPIIEKNGFAKIQKSKVVVMQISRVQLAAKIAELKEASDDQTDGVKANATGQVTTQPATDGIALLLRAAQYVQAKEAGR